MNSSVVLILMLLVSHCRQQKIDGATKNRYSATDDVTQYGDGADGARTDYLHRKRAEIDAMLQRVNVKYGGFETQKDELEVRVISSTHEQISRNPDALVTAVEAFGSTSILVEDNVLALHDHGEHAVLEFTRVLRDIDGFRMVKVTEHDGLTFIMVAFHDHLELFLSRTDWTRVKPAQSLTSGGLEPFQMEFVQWAGLLHLVVAYRDGHGGRADAVVYVWAGSHWDEAAALPAGGATALCVVFRPDHYFVVIAESLARERKNQVSIYRIGESGKYEVHRLATPRVVHALCYEDFYLDVEDYVLLLDEDGGATALLLQDEEFVPAWSKPLPVAAKSTLAYLEAVPVLFNAYGNKTQLFTLTRGGPEPLTSLEVYGAATTCLEVFEPRYGLYRLLASTSARRTFLAVSTFEVRRTVYVAPPPADPAEECISGLQKELESRQEVIDKMAAKMQFAELIENKSYGVLTLDHEVTINDSNIDSIFVDTDRLMTSEEDMYKLEETVSTLLDALERDLDDVAFKDRPIEINHPVIINGDLKAKELKTESALAKDVNGIPFTPDSFLMEGKEINMMDEDGTVRELHVKNLNAPNIFASIIAKDPEFKTLKASNIVVPTDKFVNGIKVDEIVLKDFKGVIRGEKTVSRVQAERVTARNLGGVNIEEEMLKSPTLAGLRTTGDVHIGNLLVQDINGVNIDKFMNEVFLKNLHDTVNGEIVVTGDVHTEGLTTKVFDGIPSKELFTKESDQVVQGNFAANTLSFNEAIAGTVNQLDLNRDVALTSRNELIKGPVTVNDLNVRSNLILSCKMRGSLCGLVDEKPKELRQVYDAPVYVNGSLTVKNLRFASDAKMKIFDEDFTSDVKQLFWVHDLQQDIPKEVTFNAGLTVGDTNVINLNGIAIDKYVTVDTDFSDIPVHIDELHVTGNFDAIPESHCARLAVDTEDVVAGDGHYVITGKKVFKGTVSARHANIEAINDIDMEDVILSDDVSDRIFTGNVVVDDLIVRGNLRLLCDISAKRVNRFPLDKVAELAIKINEDSSIESATFMADLVAKDIIINQGPLTKIVKTAENMYKGVNVTIDGDLKAEGGINHVQTINNIDFESYIGQVVDINIGGSIGGVKTFENGLNVVDMNTENKIHGINFKDLTAKALRKSGNQAITANYKIFNLRARNIDTRFLNDIPTSTLINTAFPFVLNSSLTLNDATVLGPLNAKSDFDIKKCKSEMENLGPRCWNQVQIEGGIDWRFGGHLQNIVDNAVHAQHQNIITGNVTIAGPVSAVNLVSRDISGVSLEYIAQDAVFREAQDQTVSGLKQFQAPVVVNTMRVFGALTANASSDGPQMAPHNF